MGVFDSYFDPGTYQGSSGGLVDRLMAQLGVQSQYSPGVGFQQQPEQAATMGIGGYQMPRMGSADLYQPQQMMTPPNAQPTQGQQAQALPQILDTPAPSGGFGNALAGAMANAHTGPLGMLLGGVAGALGMGQGSAANQEKRSRAEQYKSLVAAGMPQEKALLSVLNPTLGAKLMDEQFGKQYGFTTLPDGTMVRTDAREGTAEPVYSGGAKPTFGIIGEEDGRKQYGWIDPNKRTVTPMQLGGADDRGTVTGPDGKPIPIPPGVDRKTFVNEISKTNADAATGKMTEVQAKASSYAARMELAEKSLQSLDKQGSGFWNRLTETVPVIGGTSATNWMQSNDYQKYRQARDNFISGVLRQESGAAIAPSEFTRTEKEYFPQPGDSAETVAQKAKARAIVIDQMKRAAGPGYKSPSVGGAEKADPLGIR